MNRHQTRKGRKETMSMKKLSLLIQTEVFEGEGQALAACVEAFAKATPEQRMGTVMFLVGLSDSLATTQQPGTELLGAVVALTNAVYCGRATLQLQVEDRK